jgi:hypothetical protein
MQGQFSAMIACSQSAESTLLYEEMHTRIVHRTAATLVPRQCASTVVGHLKRRGVVLDSQAFNEQYLSSIRPNWAHYRIKGRSSIIVQFEHVGVMFDNKFSNYFNPFSRYFSGQ